MSDRRSIGGADGAAGFDDGQQSFAGSLGNAVGDFIVDIAQELFTAQIIDFITDLDCFLDALGDKVDNTEHQVFRIDRIIAFFVEDRVLAGYFKSNFQVALQIALSDQAGDAVSFPGGLYNVIDKLRNRNGAADIFGQQSTALGVLVRLDVIGIGFQISLAVSDFFVSHNFSFLHFRLFV